MKLKFLIILICIYSSLFSQNTNCTPQVEPIPSPALLIPRLIWYNQTATTLNVQKVQNNINDWTAGGMVNRPIADGESITFRSNSGIKAVGLALKKTEANMLWRQPHSVLYGFYINRWSGTAYPMESQGSAATRIDYENEGRPWNDNSVFKIKRVCNKVYYYMDDIQFPHVSTIINSEDLYFDMNFKDVLGWVYDVTIYGACGIQDCTNGSITPTFTQIDPICAGGTFTLPTTSNNAVPVTGTWSPAINNQATTTYTFTPNAGQSASTTTMTVTVNSPITPTFTQIAPICAGGSFTLPTTSNNGITGIWLPSINNQATTTYTFTPNEGQCATTETMIVEVNPMANLVLTSSNNIQIVDANSPLQPITYNLENGASGVTVTGLPTGVSYVTQGNDVTISGTPTVAGTFNYTVSTPGGCGVTIAQGTITVSTPKDLKLAPNSYIFTGKDYSPTTGKYDGAEVDGLFIPVEKAYAMWSNGLYMGGATVPTGTITADVLWEDNIGLIKSGANYALELIGTGEKAKIKVPVNKVKKGNAVITYKINGEIYWSWHVWVTDDPTNGTTYKSFDDVKRELSDGTLETIPSSEWGFMDRNLGAIGSSLTGEGWAKNGGLLYQWGRKDPIPPLVSKGNDSYEVSGSIGNVLYRDAYARIASNTTESYFPTFSYINFETLKKYQNRSTANVTDNIRLSVKNPLALIYIKEDTDNSSIPAPSLYSSTDGYHYVNWFGSVPGLGTKELSKVNLWSDNSKGIVDNNDMINFNDPNNAKPYRNKSSYDPCPNGWRVPSVLSANWTDNLFTKYSPYGIKGDFTNQSFSIPPGSTLSGYLKGIKVYPLIGFDMSNINGSGNMGIYPGTGFLGRGVSTDGAFHPAQTYTDQHETYLWTATMTMLNNNALPYSTEARYLRLTPDPTQFAKYPDQTNYPNVFGEYTYNPMKRITTNSALGCRCIKDPLFVKNNYVFNPEFYKEITEFKDGLDNPNSYLTEKSSDDTYIEIPVNKAFSVQSQYLGNTAILNSNNYNSLKANVLWADRNDLITNVTIINPTPSSLEDLNNSKIRVKVNANKIGNAVVTLHNGSITNPIYWSWHIWVSNSTVSSITYKNDTPVPTENYVNYTKNGFIQETTFMDRNLGAIEVFPDIIDTENPSVSEKTLIDNSQGLHYQWGRKDPIPTFLNVFGTPSNIYTGNTNASGVVSYSTPISGAAYNSTYPVPYNTYKQSIGTADKIDARIAKILKYSVENPLRFMKPDAAYKIRTDVTYTLGADWLIDTQHHNLYPERWGRDGKKSVFDPCPNGWRIPEPVSGAQVAATIKDSPWSLKTNSEGSFPSVGNTEPTYFGVPVRIPKSSPAANEPWRVKGFIFNNSNYNIGKYPKGYTRGFRSTANGDFGGVNHTVYNTSPAQVNNSGIWHSVLTANFTGRGNFLGFDSAGRWAVRKQDIDPYVGMNCRCVKVKTDTNGNEQGPVLSHLPISPNATQKATNTFTKKEINNLVEKDKLSVYPNPVKDILHINAKDDKDYYYQIYNMSGQLVKEGKFDSKQTNVSSLTSGVYLIRINNSENIVKIIKQ